MQKQIAILIPTILDDQYRIDTYSRLINKLKSQIDKFELKNRVQIISLGDTLEMTVGEKRNYLVDLAHLCKYVIFIDDDDDISEYYIKLIYEATLEGVDVVTFNGKYFIDNVFNSNFSISKNFTNKDEGAILYRKPNHICCVKREIAIQCKFPPINFREDSAYSDAINPLIKTEKHIQEDLYFYMYSISKSKTLGR